MRNCVSFRVLKSVFLLGALLLSCVPSYARCPDAACNAVADRCHVADKAYTKQILDATGAIRGGADARGPEGNKSVAAADALVHLWESGDCAVMMQSAKIPGLAEQLARERHEAATSRAMRGVGYYTKGDLDSAIADFNQALQIDPKFANAYSTRGEIYEAKGDLDSAIADFSRAIQIDPNNIDYLNDRCWGRAFAGRDLSQALDDCNQALRLRPNNAHVLNSRGLVQLKLGAFDQAIMDYGAAVAQNPKDANSLYGRGIAKLKTGDAVGGDADFAASKAIKSDIAQQFAKYGVNTENLARPVGAQIAPERTTAPSPTASVPATDCAHAETHWKSAEQIGTLEVYEDHLARFPNCDFATLARARIEALKKIEVGGQK